MAAAGLVRAAGRASLSEALARTVRRAAVRNIDIWQKARVGKSKGERCMA